MKPAKYLLTFGFIYNALFLCVFTRKCPWSTKTVKYVESCPENRSGMEKRAKIKNCKLVPQNCTEPNKFKYHCVINEMGDKFVEVCAEEYFIHDFCAEYNSYGETIQEHFNLKCLDVKPPCPDRYLSTAAYLYNGCYDVVKKKKQKLKTASSINAKTTQKGHIVFILMTLPVAGIIGIVLCVLTGKIDSRTNVSTAKVNTEGSKSNASDGKDKTEESQFSLLPENRNSDLKNEHGSDHGGTSEEQLNLQKKSSICP